MFTILFWNVNGKPLGERVAALARQHAVDLVILAECDDAESVRRALDGGPDRPWFALAGAVEQPHQPKVFAPSPDAGLPLIEEAPYYSIREVRAVPGVRTSLVVAAAHLPSKKDYTDIAQMKEAEYLAAAITSAETAVGHSRLVVVGDLNMNPFEPGVASAAGLHAVMTRALAADGSRVIRRRHHPILYNPMWQFFGDGTPGPAGTYFYRKADEVCFFWNIFDQALVRPDLLPRLPAGGVTILDGDSIGSYLTKGQRPAGRLSDHLPILVRLDMSEG